MAKKGKNKNRKKPAKKVPLLTVLGLVGGFSASIDPLMSGDIRTAINNAVGGFTGYDPGSNNFSMDRLKRGALPLLIGIGGSMVATKIGANRRFNVPVLKL